MSLITAIAASKPAGGAVVASAIVAGAGTSGVNGTYTERGTHNGKPYYNLEGQPDSTNDSALVWKEIGVLAWHITFTGGATMYNNNAEDVAFPWDSAAWFEDNGDSPPPTVTEG